MDMAGEKHFDASWFNNSEEKRSKSHGEDSNVKISLGGENRNIFPWHFPENLAYTTKAMHVKECTETLQDIAGQLKNLNVKCRAWYY